MAACGIAVLVVLAIFYRMVFAHRLRVPGGRTRQPRLGLVDAFSLDGQRQLVLIRRDNVEHLVMIGGPNDVLVEVADQPGRLRANREANMGSTQPAPARRGGRRLTHRHAVRPVPVQPVAAVAPAPPVSAAVGRRRLALRPLRLQLPPLRQRLLPLPPLRAPAPSAPPAAARAVQPAPQPAKVAETTLPVPAVRPQPRPLPARPSMPPPIAPPGPTAGRPNIARAG